MEHRLEKQKFDNITHRDRIYKGWSGDAKYRAVTSDGVVYLLRISPRERSADREPTSVMQKRVSELGVSMCLPVEYGVCNEGFYILQSRINGTDAKEGICSYYIEKNRSLLEGRPQCYQHGDYHIGNMMLEQGKLVIIDFDRYDFGNPWEDFNRIVWRVGAAPAFAAGMVYGIRKRKE